MVKIVKAAAGYMAVSAPSPLDRLMEAKAVAELNIVLFQLVLEKKLDLMEKIP